MKRATWCGCGCCGRKLMPILPTKALMLMSRRRIAEAHARASLVSEEQLRRARELLAMPPAGNA